MQSTTRQSPKWSYHCMNVGSNKRRVNLWNVCKVSKKDSAGRTELDVDVFETAGTEKDTSGWEPFNGDGSMFKNLISSIDYSEPTSFDGVEKAEYDPLRDGPLRYLGYLIELGEAFAAWLFPGGVQLSYAVAISYVLFDTWDKYNKTLKDAKEKLGSRTQSVDAEELASIIGLERGIDTLLWQLLASVAIPGYTIHTVVAVVHQVSEIGMENEKIQQSIAAGGIWLGISSKTMAGVLDKSLPTFVGLLTIPFIVHPIDSAVHAFLNATLRPFMRNYICNSAGGRQAGLAICDCDKE